MVQILTNFLIKSFFPAIALGQTENGSTCRPRPPGGHPGCSFNFFRRCETSKSEYMSEKCYKESMRLRCCSEFVSTKDRNDFCPASFSFFVVAQSKV